MQKAKAQEEARVAREKREQERRKVHEEKEKEKLKEKKRGGSVEKEKEKAAKLQRRIEKAQRSLAKMEAKNKKIGDILPVGKELGEEPYMKSREEEILEGQTAGTLGTVRLKVEAQAMAESVEISQAQLPPSEERGQVEKARLEVSVVDAVTTSTAPYNDASETETEDVSSDVSSSDSTSSDEDGSSSSESSSEDDVPEKERIDRDKRHNVDPKSRATNQKSLCRSFLRTGRCKFGKRCRYSHERPKRSDFSTKGRKGQTAERPQQRLSIYQRVCSFFV